MDPSKSYVRELATVWQNILADVRRTYPALETEWVRDSSRFQSLVKTRGLPLLAVDLPACSKHLDRCLDAGQYLASGLPTTSRVSRRVPIPKFLRGLYLLIFDETGRLRDDCDVTAISFLRQLLLVGKKVKAACSDAATQLEIEEFVSVDASLPDPPLGWNNGCVEDLVGAHYFRAMAPYRQGLRQGKNHLTFNHLWVLDRVVQHLTSALGHYDYRDWKFRHGPGAISERTGPVNKWKFVNWSERLDGVYPYCEVAFHSYSAWVEAAKSGTASSVDPSSRLIAVPKTLTKPRLIAAEPSEHMFCQQNIWHYFCSRVRNSWLSRFLDFNDQKRNQELCVKGSVDGSLATLDLSSASDRVTCLAVQCTFWRLPNLLMALAATRTRSVELPDGRLVHLKKFSTMGNACTFPVESLIFLAVSLAAVLSKRGLPPTREEIEKLEGEVAVFGDDIVIPKDCREDVVELLELLEFKVNVQKSYAGSNFRESCGVDAFRGQVVTPVYWREPNLHRPGSVASVVDVHNNFYKRGYLCVANYLASTIRRAEAAFVPADSGVFGLHSRVLPDPRSLYKTRWNKALHREEVLLPVVQSTQQRTVDQDDSVLLQFLTEGILYGHPWLAGYGQRPSSRIVKKWVARDQLTPLR